MRRRSVSLHREQTEERSVAGLELNLEADATARFGAGLDEASALTNDAIDGGESEAGALSDGFGSKEGLEDMRQLGFVHT